MGFTARRLQRDLLAAMPSEPAPVIARLIDRDAVNPGLQRTLPAEGLHIPEHLEKNFLHNVGRVAGVIGKAAYQVIDRVLEALDQNFIGGFVALAEPGDQLPFVLRDGRRRTRLPRVKPGIELEGLSYDEIAEILETSLGTVKSRILRGREALRQRLTERLRRESAPAGWNPTTVVAE